jgi:hypothetical protein
MKHELRTDITEGIFTLSTLMTENQQKDLSHVHAKLRLVIRTQTTDIQ